MKFMRDIQVRISTLKTFSFRTDHLDRQCKLKSARSVGIGLIRVHTVAIPSAHCCRTSRNNRRIVAGQGPAVLVAGTGWKLFDFGGFFLTLMGFLPGNETVIFCIFL